MARRLRPQPKPGEERGDDLPPPPAYDENPAVIDAHRTFLWTLIGAALFIGTVVSFIL